MNLEQLTTIQKNLQLIVDHLNEKDTFNDLVDDKDQIEIVKLQDIYKLCDCVCSKYQELYEND